MQFCQMIKEIRLFTVFIAFLLTSVQATATDTLTVGYTIAPPFIEAHDGQLSGVSYWLWNEVVENHDFHCDYVEMSLDSLILSLEKGSVDVAINPMSISAERMKRFDYSVPYFIAHSSFLEPEVGFVTQVIDFIDALFSYNLFKVLLVLSGIILLFGFLVWFFERRGNQDEFDKSIKGLWSGFWWSAVTMTTVGYGDKSPRTFGGRIVALVWMFAALLLVSGFTASIASVLTVEQMHSKNNTLNQYRDEVVGTIKHSTTDAWMTQHLFSAKSDFETIEEAFEALERGEVNVIAYDEPILKDFIKEHAIKNYTLSDIKYNPQFYAFCFRHDLKPYIIKAINISTLKEVETLDWQAVLTNYHLEE